MNCEVRRRWETSRSITGELWIDGQFECYTLEPARDSPVHPGHPCIPAGRYRVALTLSPHLEYTTPELLEVPGRSDIRWHIGNYPKDVLGCAVVGLTHAEDFVGDSRRAFEEKLMPLLKSAYQEGEEIWASYLDPPPAPASA
jgi:Steigviridae/Suoliviridae L,D-carboxypeptidase/transpeptidase